MIALESAGHHAVGRIASRCAHVADIVSDELSTLETLPGRIAMIGGGYIAVEFACLLHRFGVRVTILLDIDDW